MNKEKISYENVLGDIACYVAKQCDLTPSEAVGIIMNDERTDSIVEDIKGASSIDLESLAKLYLDEKAL